MKTSRKEAFRVHDECLFSALALNGKRLVKALTGAQNPYFAITWARVYAIKLMF